LHYNIRANSHIFQKCTSTPNISEQKEIKEKEKQKQRVKKTGHCALGLSAQCPESRPSRPSPPLRRPPPALSRADADTATGRPAVAHPRRPDADKDAPESLALAPNPSSPQPLPSLSLSVLPLRSTRGRTDPSPLAAATVASDAVSPCHRVQETRRGRPHRLVPSDGAGDPRWRRTLSPPSASAPVEFRRPRARLRS
jgi:hypothetical protein